MKRIHHSFDKWEDYHHNFYGGQPFAKTVLQDYANLLKDLPRFEEALITIITMWKYSCEHNLSNEGLNRVAYLGQAANALVHKAPSSVSMGAYNLLTKEEQIAADGMAQKYLEMWLEANDVDFKKVS